MKINSNHILIALFAILTFVSILLVALGIFNFVPGTDNIYYLYSTAAQAIATFIAFFLAGYALIYQAMDNLESRDDTLREVHYEIKKECHNQIKYLASITGLAILFCLVLVWSNGIDYPFKNFFYVITDILIVITVIFGIKIVINIIDPDRIKLTSKELLGENEDFTPDEEGIDEALFIKEFIKLEKNTKMMFKKYDIPITGRYTEFIGFRQMIESLKRVGLIKKKEYKRLRKVNEYRNLIIHGEEDQVNQKMYNEVKDLQKVITQVDKEQEKKLM